MSRVNKFVTWTISVFVLLSITSWCVLGYWAHQRSRWIEQGRTEMAIEIGRKNVLDDRKNEEVQREIDRGISEGVDSFTREFQRKQAARVASDQVSRENIERMIAQDPEFYTSRLCTVPDAMLAERNRIRDGGE